MGYYRLNKLPVSSQQDKIRTEEDFQCFGAPPPLIFTMSFGGRTDEEIRKIIELAQVTLLASISLFSVPVTKYMNIYKEVT